ncbi:hypothetical protein F4809DRAFT_644750 [Biscogniauxia mediterranea]|nr:hypothetical protein F4809DRAFT_644750 [Biscogniauxia mediterranea]
MHSVMVSLVTLLAAASIAAPVSMQQQRRGLPGVGSLTSPVSSILQEVGKQTPDAVSKATDTVGGGTKKAPAPVPAPKNSTAKATPTKDKSAASNPLTGLVGGLTGGLGGLGGGLL